MRDFLLCDDGNLTAAVPVCEKHGMGIEMQSFYDPALLDRDPNAISVHLEATTRIGLRAVHGCFGDLCPGSFDAMVRNVAKTRFEQSYSVVLQLNATHLVLHHGYVPHTSTPDRWLLRCTAFWKECLINKTDGIKFHVENVLDWEPKLLADLIDSIGSDQVDANLDIGHVHCNARVDLMEWIRLLNSRIGYVHIHDNHGKEDEHLALGMGNIPLSEALQEIERVAPTAVWAIESNVADLDASISWLKRNGFVHE